MTTHLTAIIRAVTSDMLRGQTEMVAFIKTTEASASYMLTHSLSITAAFSLVHDLLLVSSQSGRAVGGTLSETTEW